MITDFPVRTQPVKSGWFDRVLVLWFNSVQATANQPANNPTPTAATPGVQGQMACDDNWLYIYTPGGAWKKVALTAL